MTVNATKRWFWITVPMRRRAIQRSGADWRAVRIGR
jgi:hypothetical protein